MAEKQKTEEPTLALTATQLAAIVGEASKNAVAEAMRQVKAQPADDESTRRRKLLDDIAARPLKEETRVPCACPDHGTTFTAVITDGIFTRAEDLRLPDRAMIHVANGGLVPDGREITNHKSGLVTKDHQFWCTTEFTLPIYRLQGQLASRALRNYRLDDPTHPAHAQTKVTTVSPAAAIPRAATTA